MNNDKILMYVATVLLVLGWVCTLIAGRPKRDREGWYRPWMYTSMTLFAMSMVMFGLDLLVVRQ